MEETLYKVTHVHKYGDDVYLFKSNKQILTETGSYSDKLEEQVIDLFNIDFDYENSESLSIVKVGNFNDILSIL